MRTHAGGSTGPKRLPYQVSVCTSAAGLLPRRKRCSRRSRGTRAPSMSATSEESAASSRRSRSCVSAYETVMPHARWRVWPMSTAGMPAKVAPATVKSGPSRCARKKTDGSSWLRCGSLHSTGTPAAVFEPCTTQEFDAPSWSRPSDWARAAAGPGSAARRPPAPPPGPAPSAAGARPGGEAASPLACPPARGGVDEAEVLVARPSVGAGMDEVEVLVARPSVGAGMDEVEVLVARPSVGAGMDEVEV
ncbi:MAG: hypothetical protein INH37_09755, partial [Myxococcaceae bacterium]|nr:hypothetical protein [Myxococcaceae bacterium]